MQLLTFPLSRAEFRSCTSSTVSVPPTRSRRSRFGTTRTLKDMVDMDAVDAFREDALNPEHPVLHGTAQNPDIFFQAREACNTYYMTAFRTIVERVHEQGQCQRSVPTTSCSTTMALRMLRTVIVAMGSVCDTIEETIDYLLAQGSKVGLVKVRLYRPFVCQAPDRRYPGHCQDRSLFSTEQRSLAPSASRCTSMSLQPCKKDSKFQDAPVFAGRYGLGSKDCNSGSDHRCLQQHSQKPKRYSHWVSTTM